MTDLGRIIIFAGLTLIVLGGIIVLFGKVPGMGKLPGDILIKRENFSFYFPLTTSILLSIVLSLIMYLGARKRTKFFYQFYYCPL